MADAITNQWVNQPQQARSRETMNRFVIAAETLLRDKQFDEITIGELVEVAERTVGSFYARFEDKWALLRTVMDRYSENMIAFMTDMVAADEWRDHSVQEMIHVTARAAVGLYRSHGHILRAGLSFSATDEAARKARQTNYGEVRRMVGDAILDHPDVVRSAKLEADLALGLEAVEAVLDGRLLYSCDWRAGEPDWEQVTADVEALFEKITGLP